MCSRTCARHSRRFHFADKCSPVRIWNSVSILVHQFEMIHDTLFDESDYFLPGICYGNKPRQVRDVSAEAGGPFSINTVYFTAVPFCQFQPASGCRAMCRQAHLLRVCQRQQQFRLHGVMQYPMAAPRSHMIPPTTLNQSNRVPHLWHTLTFCRTRCQLFVASNVHEYNSSFTQLNPVDCAAQARNELAYPNTENLVRRLAFSMVIGYSLHTLFG